MFKIIAVWSLIREVNHSVKKLVSNKWPLFKDEGCKCCTVHFSENLSKMGRSRHCSKEQLTLIKMLIKEGKTYKKVQKMIGCSAKMIPNALKWQPKPRCRRKWKTTILNGSKNSQNGKDSANDQLQGDQRKSKVTCEYCNNQKTPV